MQHHLSIPGILSTLVSYAGGVAAAVLVWTALLLPVAGAAAEGAEMFTLVRDGAAVAEIVAPPDALADIPPWLSGAELAIGENQLGPATVHPWTRAGVEAAVEDFNAALEKCLGVALPVFERRTPGSRAIVFEVEPAKLMKDDTFSIEFPDKDTLLVRGSGRSVRWALNHILREHAGVRWLFLDHTHYPRSESLAVPRRDIQDAPSYCFRRKPPYYRQRMLDYHMGMNAKHEPLPRQEGLHAMIDLPFPLEKYAPDQSWPVEIMPVRDGEKLVMPPPRDNQPLRRQSVYTHGWHPCFSNPRTAEIAVENILETMAADPHRQLVGLGVMDLRGHCECDDCLAAVAGRRHQRGLPDYSDLYYAWANKVAEGVTEQYPHVIFETIPYREVWNPPSFDLHPSIVPFICIDIHQMMDPEYGAIQWELVRTWGERARHLAVYDYAWGMNGYALPRVYYSLHAEFYKEFHRLGGVGLDYSGYNREGAEGEGPKLHLLMRLAWDIDLNPEAIIDEWIVAAVGERAAPYLRAYFRFWEDYATGDRIRRTEWFQSSLRGGYFRVWDWASNRTQSYTFALAEGDMARMRDLMERVVANTDTPGQAERAERLMLAFEYYECNAYALFSEIIPPEGVLPGPEAALAMVEAAPEAYAFAAKQQSVLEAISAGQPASADRITRMGDRSFDIHQTMTDIFARVGKHMDDPGVKAAMDALAQDDRIPPAPRNRLLAGAARAHLRTAGREDTPRARADTRSPGDIVLDGDLGDPFWQGLPAYRLQDAKDGGRPSVDTDFRVAWTDDAIYFGVRCKEPDIENLRIGATEDGDRGIFDGDTLEFLIETPYHSYYQIVVNPAGAVVDLDRSAGINYDWSSGARAAAHIGDGYWSVEIRIPLARAEDVDVTADWGVAGSRPTPRAPWFFNVCRQRRRGDERENSTFSPTGGGFHEPSRFGRLVAR